MEKGYLVFNRNIGKHKPNSIMNKNTTCPFCNLTNVEDVLDDRGSMKLIRNIFPVFENAFQTVLIEDDSCEKDLSTYDDEYRYNLILFGLQKWKEMIDSQKYKSVIFYKNHGQFSGGSLIHSHMQIVGLHDIDCMEKIQSKHFEGITIHEQGHVTFNISTKPIVGMTEFNIICNKENNVWQLSKYLQIATHYILNHFNVKGQSYNLFFYTFDSKLIVKVVSRTVTSPYMLGYLIPQVQVDLQNIVSEVNKLYFKGSSDFMVE